MNPPLPMSPASAVRSLRSLRYHDPVQGAFPSDGGNGDDEQHGRRRRLNQPPAPAKLSLCRILEQHNLLPPSSTHTAFEAPASHLPSLRFARVSRGGLDNKRGFHPLDQTRPRPTTSSDGGDEYNSGSSSNVSQYSLPPQRHQPETTDTTPPPASSRLPESSAHSVPASGYSRRRTMTPEERRKARTCGVDGCSNYIVDNHRCFRHGGGKRCSIDDCNSSAKQHGLCWRHGGSVLCKVEGCNRGVKVRGLCWGHGGGKKKKQAPTAQATDSSTDSAGPRCIFDGCQNAPTLHSFCDKHSQEVVRPGYIFEL